MSNSRIDITDSSIVAKLQKAYDLLKSKNNPYVYLQVKVSNYTCLCRNLFVNDSYSCYFGFICAYFDNRISINISRQAAGLWRIGAKFLGAS